MRSDGGRPTPSMNGRILLLVGCECRKSASELGHTYRKNKQSFSKETPCEPTRAARRGGFQIGGFPDLASSVIIVLVCPLGDCPSVLAYSMARNIPERAQDTIRPFPPKKRTSPQFGRPPVQISNLRQRVGSNAEFPDVSLFASICPHGGCFDHGLLSKISSRGFCGFRGSSKSWN